MSEILSKDEEVVPEGAPEVPKELQRVIDGLDPACFIDVEKGTELAPRYFEEGAFQCKYAGEHVARLGAPPRDKYYVSTKNPVSSLGLEVPVMKDPQTNADVKRFFDEYGVCDPAGALSILDFLKPVGAEARDIIFGLLMGYNPCCVKYYVEDRSRKGIHDADVMLNDTRTRAYFKMHPELVEHMLCPCCVDSTDEAKAGLLPDKAVRWWMEELPE